MTLNRLKDASSPAAKLYSETFSTRPWFADLFPDYRSVPAAELPAGYDSGNAFTSVCINVPVYLAWLLGRCLAAGVVVKRADLGHIHDAFVTPSGRRADVVINCSGLASRSLPGVEDKTLFPVRGQLVLVRNEAPLMLACSGADGGTDEMIYCMMRAAGGGTVLGGCAQKDNWSPDIDPALAERIKQRAVELCPELVGKGQGVEGLSVIRNAAGLRPFRENGPRVEKEIIDGSWVVHNYG
jgi:glycine/D-amino acid oxidase-like deaminating enzyme